MPGEAAGTVFFAPSVRRAARGFFCGLFLRPERGETRRGEERAGEPECGKGAPG